jgi:pimeloyl-ACP methyl ester carboxylesterase
MSHQEIDAYFTQRNLYGSQHQYEIGKREIHFITAGDSTKPLVLFLHGSPGSRSAFIHFLADEKLYSNAFLITTDRPGFGHSDFGNAERSLDKQAAALFPILTQYKKNQPVILVGHSLAGPLAAKMAIQYPDLINGIILVAPSIDPELEPNEGWFRAPLFIPPFRWLLPRSIRASNDEIFKFRKELEKMKPNLSTITCPVVVIQGEADDLVPPENADFVEQQFSHANVTVHRFTDVNHFIPWQHPEFITDAILSMLGTTVEN